MQKLTHKDLWTLEKYARLRNDFRAKAMAHKKSRQLLLGENARFYFEDEITIRYQIQEMLRIEKVFDEDGIQQELDAYNPLIPDGNNWKATLMLQFEDPVVRTQKTKELLGIEKTIWVTVGGSSKIVPFANEDMPRDNGEKTSTVHFLRFEFSPAEVDAIIQQQAITIGISHPAYPGKPVEICGELKQHLINDVDPQTVNH